MPLIINHQFGCFVISKLIETSSESELHYIQAILLGLDDEILNNQNSCRPIQAFVKKCDDNLVRIVLTHS